MPIRPVEAPAKITVQWQYQASADQVEPIHDYNIPILPFKHPPTRQDFPQIRRREKFPDQKKEKPHWPPADHGHVDDYA